MHFKKIVQRTDNLWIDLINMIDVFFSDSDQFFKRDFATYLFISWFDLFSLFIDDDNTAFMHTMVYSQSRVSMIIAFFLFFLL